jgi:DNA-binding response OmpR family regulator
MLRQELEQEGYRVLEAADGETAVRVARQELPDVITLDVMMPGLDGFDVAAVLRSDPRSMRIPIIVVSIVEDDERVHQVGIDRYLIKPIDTNQLLNDVRVLLDQRNSHRRVVVVDEDATLLETFRSTLDQQGWNVTAISDQDHAVALARDALPDLVIANADLSNRISLVEGLRAERETQDVVVILFE